MYWRKQCPVKIPWAHEITKITGYYGQLQVREDIWWESELTESPRVKTVEEMPAGQDLKLKMQVQATVSPGNCSLSKLVL